MIGCTWGYDAIIIQAIFFFQNGRRAEIDCLKKMHIFQMIMM